MCDEQKNITAEIYKIYDRGKLMLCKISEIAFFNRENKNATHK
jgi:hypothetical protein